MSLFELPPVTTRRESPSGFAGWYAAYPRHRCRQDAERAYRAALKLHSPETLMAALGALLAEHRDPAFWPYPATFLRRHLEDYLPAGGRIRPAEAPTTPVCPNHPQGHCWFSPGSGWVHQR